MTEFLTLTIDEAEMYRIINIIVRNTGISYSQMIDKTRERKAVLARHMAMYFIRMNGKASLNQIGDVFGGRDHSTVLNAMVKMHDFYATDSIFRKAMNEICEEINPDLLPKLKAIAQ